ncbi:hypothetical protein DACRYDRAFT_105247 [Dacryopinax primogenitus]|uniref:Uncharacterized protein n=1 Tax=Dacryopinax primogenitus (strain DJM 731) TaxID=1858805 RepID=M5G643_DACPD|nr:uncharacterized protein DACRYDRAFT_105247 [Dacryopinax primogenitus]EJU04179.1 hypothetical protein DACRYDRAFT_105247 [Dacryopinax primogenitus]
MATLYPPNAPFQTAMAYHTPPGTPPRSVQSSPRSSLSSLSHRPPSRSSLYPSRSSPTLPALTEDQIAASFPAARPLSVLIDDALRMEALSLAKTPDLVDHMNSADPFGSMWHNESPYDACLPGQPMYGHKSRPGSMIFPQSQWEGHPQPLPRSRRGSVLVPSPLSQTSYPAYPSYPTPTPSLNAKRASFLLLDPMDEPLSQEDAIFAHVQSVKRERRDALLWAKEREAHERAAMPQERPKKGLFSMFSRKSRPSSPSRTNSTREKKSRGEKADSSPSKTDKKATRNFSILSRKGTKLKRRPSEKHGLTPTPTTSSAVTVGSASSGSPFVRPDEEYKTTPFDAAAHPMPTRSLSHSRSQHSHQSHQSHHSHTQPEREETRTPVPVPQHTPSPAPAYTLLDPAGIVLPSSSPDELPRPPFPSRPSLRSTQQRSTSGSGSGSDSHESGASAESSEVITPQTPGTPVPGLVQPLLDGRMGKEVPTTAPVPVEDGPKIPVPDA